MTPASWHPLSRTTARTATRPEPACVGTCSPRRKVIDLEVLSVFRRQVAASQLAAPRAELAVADLLALPLRRISHRGLLLRCWELRHNLTQYDAALVALAELFDATTGARTSTTSTSVVGESFVQQLNHLALARFPDKGSAAL